MKKQALILIGGGGHCKACIDTIEQEGKFAIQGILDSSLNSGTQVLGYNIIGTDDMIPELVRAGNKFLITVGQIQTADVRRKIYDQLLASGASLTTVISPKAYVSPHATIGEGTIVMPGVVVQADVRVGKNNILNTGCSLDHDARTGHHCHISTQAVLNGNTTIGDNCFIGSNATISNGVFVANRVVIGAGSVVLKNIMNAGCYAGTPVKKLK